MLLTYLLFIFVAFGSKLLLALVTIYLLLPAELRCAECDEETIQLRMGPVGRFCSRLLLGQLQRRWCPRCGWEGLSRPLSGEAGASPMAAPRQARTPDVRP
ncbi:MAG TPA: hypothetical protein VHG28_21980 [Longimicrobiaceae bacterium]|nr:hypothetical protein [Longimicrobiaceae bacterium]